MGQLSFWSADARPRARADLEGLLCGPGRVERFGRGAAARLGVVLGPVPDPDETEPEPESEPDDPAAPADPVALWRAHALWCALRSRGVPAEIGRTGDGRPRVRTAFRADLVDLARRWAGDGASKSLPPGFELDGPRLRLWVLAAGRREGRAYVLGLDPDAPATHDALLTASRRAGLVAEPAGDPAAPTLRVTRPRARGRLVELVGARPRSAHDAVWPV